MDNELSRRIVSVGLADIAVGDGSDHSSGIGAGMFQERAAGVGALRRLGFGICAIDLTSRAAS